MSFTQFIILQIIAHILADFIFQSDKAALEKNQLGFKSKFMKTHVFIVFLLSWVASFQVNFIFGSLAIAVLHGSVDGVKKYIRHNKIAGKYVFFIDQTLHVSALLLVTMVFAHYFEFEPIVQIGLTVKELIIIGAYLFCAKPSNVFIKEILKTFEINFAAKSAEKDMELQNAGKMIGIIERWLVLTFVLLNKYEAVGFLLAAKSILRFKDQETIRTEYVLIGTMLSYGIAIAFGIVTGMM